jgi:hypothetical protein
MLTIRKEQLKVFELSAMRTYKRGLILHIHEHFPEHAGYLGDEGLMRIIEHSCTKAKEYNFETERDLCLYTDLCIMLGIGFDTDPQLPWASSILHDGSFDDPWYIMDKLWDKSMEYMVYVLGPDDVFPVKAYRLAIGYLPMDIPGFTADRMTNTVIKHMNTIWPEKVEYIGATQLKEFLRKSIYNAEYHHVTHFQGQAEFMIFSFLLGHHFYNDPAYPWVQEIFMNSPSRAIIPLSSEEKSEQVWKAFKQWLDQLFHY